MTKPFKFLCFSDGHLDPEKYGPRGREIRKRDALAVFCKMIDTALAEEVELVGCAGDFFDRSTVDPYTLAIVEGYLERLKVRNIPFVVIMGNHDRPHANYLDGSSWLSYLMKRELVVLLDSLDPSGVRFYQDGHVKVFGIPFAGAHSGEKIKELGAYIDAQKEDGDFAIVLLHLGIDVVTSYGADITVDELEPLDGVDLICTGHIHQRAEFAFGSGTPVYNPGSLTVCNVDEIEQEHGYYIYTIQDDKTFTAKYYESGDREFEAMDYDVARFSSADAFMDQIKEDTDELSPCNSDFKLKPILHLYLKGKLNFPHTDLNVNQIEELYNYTQCYGLVILHDETTAKGLDLPQTNIHSDSRNELIKGILELQAEGDDPERWAEYCQRLDKLIADNADYKEIMVLTEEYVANREGE